MLTFSPYTDPAVAHWSGGTTAVNWTPVLSLELKHSWVQTSSYASLFGEVSPDSFGEYRIHSASDGWDWLGVVPPGFPRYHREETGLSTCHMRTFSKSEHKYHKKVSRSQCRHRHKPFQACVFDCGSGRSSMMDIIFANNMSIRKQQLAVSRYSHYSHCSANSHWSAAKVRRWLSEPTVGPATTFPNSLRFFFPSVRLIVSLVRTFALGHPPRNCVTVLLRSLFWKMPGSALCHFGAKNQHHWNDAEI